MDAFCANLRLGLVMKCVEVITFPAAAELRLYRNSAKTCALLPTGPQFKTLSKLLLQVEMVRFKVLFCPPLSHLAAIDPANQPEPLAPRRIHPGCSTFRNNIIKGHFQRVKTERTGKLWRCRLGRSWRLARWCVSTSKETTRT